MSKFRVESLEFRVTVFSFIFLFVFAVPSYARAKIENLSQIEKLFMEGKYDIAASEAARLIDTGAAGREELFYLKGLSEMQLSKYPAARKTFNYMVERYPRGKRAFDGYLAIGDAYFLEGKTAESITSYNEALSRHPDHKNASTAYYKIGCAYQKLGVADKAREYLGKVKDSSPLSFEAKMASVPDSRLPPVKSGGVFDVKVERSYYVQVGYFRNEENARRMNDKLKQKGYDSRISVSYNGKTAYYTVRVGSYTTKAEADNIAKKLKSDGYKTRICR